MKLIPISLGKSAIVDDDDFEALSKFKWHATAYGYAARNARLFDGSRTIVFMHRELIAANDDWVDHIDWNRLNNSRANLRLCTPSQNHMNTRPRKNKVTSSFKGVNLIPSSGKWRAKITAKGKFFHVGCFNTEIEAARAYDAMSVKLHGEFASPNNI